MAKKIKSPLDGLSVKALKDYRLLAKAYMQYNKDIEAGLEVSWPIGWHVLNDIHKAGMSLSMVVDRLRDKVEARWARQENAGELMDTAKIGYIRLYDPKRYELIKIRHEISNLDARLSTVVHDEAESIRSTLRVLTAAVN